MADSPGVWTRSGFDPNSDAGNLGHAIGWLRNLGKVVVRSCCYPQDATVAFGMTVRYAAKASL